MSQLPPPADPNAPYTREGAATTTRSGRVNILLVDDNPDKLLTMRTILEELDENIVTANTGEEALRCMLQHEFAVILLDVKMPIMDGFETAELIRRRKRFAHTPIIFVTAYEDEMRAARGYSLGAVDYILTPIVPTILCTKVKVFAQLFRMREEISKHAEERVALAREQAARAAAEESMRRSNFLISASRVLSSSLDVGAILKGITQFAVPYLCETCVLALMDDQGRPLQLAGAASTLAGGRMPLSGEGLRTLIEGALAQTMVRALEQGEATVADIDPPHVLATSEGADGRRDTAMEIRIGQAALFPLWARGRRLGILLMGLSGNRPFGPAEHALASELVGRTAIALDNAILYSRLQDSDRRKDEFLAMLAHELRAPLAPIRSAAAILHHIDGDDQLLRDSREIIERQVAHLARLVDDLLDVARLSQGKIRLEQMPVMLQTVIARAVETNRPGIDARRHRLDVRLPEEAVYLEGDAVRLAQVFGNLVHNAAKYTTEGGTIAIEAERQGDRVSVRVRDNGSGIAPELLPHVFELFVQANRSMSRSDDGLGVGLTLVRTLVELHGGTIEAHSEGVGKGSEFVLRFPVLSQVPALPLPRAEEMAPPGLPRNSVRVLLVDDNPDSIETMGMLLHLYGHEVRKAGDGPTALRIAREFKPQLVVCDIGLPGMDGLEVTRRLREQSAGALPLIVAMTGYARDEDRRLSEQAGFDHHLVKPVDPGLLMTMINELGERASLKKAPAV